MVGFGDSRCFGDFAAVFLIRDPGEIGAALRDQPDRAPSFRRVLGWEKRGVVFSVVG